MKNLIVIILCVILIPVYADDQLNELFIGAAEKSKCSVVYINSMKSRNGKNEKVSYGSGTVVSDEGYILTNYHVVREGSFFQIILPDGTSIVPQKLSNGLYYLFDKETDIAVLKIDSSLYNLKPIVAADSSKVRTGEMVLAVGHPYGLENSVSSGIVSSIGRSDIGFSEIEDFIQTDTPINPGNSGGPLVNTKGEMVGVNTAIKTASGGFEGISFSIPSNLAIKICRELIDHGKVKRGWLGLVIKEGSGESVSGKVVRVVSVHSDSPASYIGILPDDVILEADGVRITSRSKILKMVKNKPVGSSLNIVISRKGKIKRFSLPIKEKDSYSNVSNAAKKIFSAYGFEVDQNASSGLIIISYVSPEKSDIHKNKLKEGDYILAVNGKYFETIEEFAEILLENSDGIKSVKIIRESKELDVSL